MAKTTTTTKSSKSTESAPIVDTPAQVADKAPKVKKVKAPKAEAAPAATAATPTDSVSAPVADDALALEGDSNVLAEKSVEFLAKLQQIGSLIASLKTEYRTLEKQWSRELKTAQKQSSKRKRKSGNRAPSGFVKPTRISDELAKFLDKPAGTEMARTDVTREINVYIRNHNLQDKTNGRKINPDSKLSALLKLKKTDELTYFNLQKFMSHHFAKAVKAEGVETA
jgi:chromatin remodeling complex protein RSC6